jgi:hypothetical protein
MSSKFYEKYGLPLPFFMTPSCNIRSCGQDIQQSGKKANPVRKREVFPRLRTGLAYQESHALWIMDR